MSKLAAQQYVKTVRMEENQEILKALAEFQSQKPELTIGVNAYIGGRENQQDTSFGQVDGSTGFAIVCDGMGGLEGGELASQTAVEMMLNDFYSLPNHDNLPEFFRAEAYKMNDAVRGLRNSSGERMDAGTTIVTVCIDNGKMHWLSVGDSKIYIIRGEEMVPANKEHNYGLTLKELYAAGKITKEEMENDSRAEALISYLGIDGLELMDINEQPFELMDKDVVLLCSDGLYKALEEDVIMGVVQTADSDMQLAAKRLLDAVKDKRIKGQDNTSVVLLQYHKN